MSRSWSDEQISAFLDAELSPADMDALARDVDTDAALAARVETFATATRAYVEAVSEIDAIPMSKSAEKVLAAPPTAKVLSFRPRAVSQWLNEHRAMAAGLLCAALVGGIASGLSSEASSFAPSPDGLIVASAPLYRVLETGATGEAREIATGVSATARVSFASADGFCRQFDVASNRGTVTAIACREDTGWRTQVAAYGPASISGDYRAATGAKSQALEAFIDQHISGAPLDAAAEKQAIDRGWRE